LLSRAGLRSLTPWFTEWTALGVCRLHYTIATGEITSKSGAGEYALQTFPARWHKVIGAAIAIRNGEGDSYAEPLTRRADCLTFARMVIADAKQMPAS
jgi:hypothetical protein